MYYLARCEFSARPALVCCSISLTVLKLWHTTVTAWTSFFNGLLTVSQKNGPSNHGDDCQILTDYQNYFTIHLLLYIVYCIYMLLYIVIYRCYIFNRMAYPLLPIICCICTTVEVKSSHLLQITKKVSLDAIHSRNVCLRHIHTSVRTVVT